jgi:hypothetical protein
MRGGAVILLSYIAFASFGQRPKSHSLRAEDTQSAQRELIQKYSVVWHNDRTKPGRLSRQSPDVGNVALQPVVWEKLVRKPRRGLMPPGGMPRPDKAAAQALVSCLETSLGKVAETKPNSGRPDTFHHLNRAEYQNALRDLPIDASDYCRLTTRAMGLTT